MSIYRAHCTISDGMLLDLFPEDAVPLAVVEFRSSRPIVSEPIIGNTLGFDPTFYWKQVMSLNDADDPNEPDSSGVIGAINMWPAMNQQYVRFQRERTGDWFTCSITEAVYGTHIAFDTLPECTFLTNEEYEEMRAGYRRMNRVKRRFKTLTQS